MKNLKTRNSLVSNSSSASFICPNKIEYVSDQMWKCVIEDFKDIDWGTASENAKNKKWLNSMKKKLHALCKQPNVSSGEVGIRFPTINEDTYIIRKGAACYITTCNNINWDDVDSLQPADDVYSEIKDDFFIDVDSGVCVSYKMQYSKDTLYCPQCFKDSISYNNIGSHNHYYLGKDGEKYCMEHFCKLTDKPPAEKSK